VRVFEAGADDYLVTPIRPVELSARLRAVLRRTADSPVRQQHSDTLVAGDLEIRLNEHKVYRHGNIIDLSPMEFRLLTVLVKETGRAVSHAKLIANVWGPEYVDCRHYLRLYVKYLRSKIETDPKNPRLVLSEWGVGYRFEPAAAA
jgi:two-component system KDP operon response regulator KdpE